MGPASNPSAVVKVGVPRIAVAHESFVMAAAGAKRASPTRVTVGLGLNVTAIKKSRLFFLVDAGKNTSQSVLVRVHKPMARRNVAGGTNADKSEARSARMRLIDALVQLGKRVADVGKAVEFSAQRKLQVFFGQFPKLGEHFVHARFVYGIQTVGRGGYRSKAHLVKTKIMFQMTVNLENIHCV